MTTLSAFCCPEHTHVVEAYRLDRYDNLVSTATAGALLVVEAYRLDRYDNCRCTGLRESLLVVEAYRLDRYDNSFFFGSLCPYLRL